MRPWRQLFLFRYFVVFLIDCALNAHFYSDGVDILVQKNGLTLMWGHIIFCEVKVRWITPFSTIFGYFMAVSFYSWRNKLFLGMNQQPSVSNWQLPLMGFEPQRRGASSFKARRLNHSATEAPSSSVICWRHIPELLFRKLVQNCSSKS